MTDQPKAALEQFLATADRLKAILKDHSEVSAARRLTNTTWTSVEGEVAYSFRAAGDLIAAVLGEGDYLDWYCSGPAGRVSSEIASAMSAAGWSAHHG